MILTNFLNEEQMLISNISPYKFKDKARVANQVFNSNIKL